MFRDPYAHVGPAELLQASLARIAIFYVTLAFLIVSLWYSSFGKRLSLLLAILAPPHIALALAYESGDLARYLPLVGTPLVLESGWRLAKAAYGGLSGSFERSDRRGCRSYEKPPCACHSENNCSIREPAAQ